MVDINQITMYFKIGGAVVGTGVIFWGWWKMNLVKSSVGWKHIEALGKVKKGFKGKDLVLRIKSPAGKETYQDIKHSPIIEYEYLVKGKKAKKYVIYDERAVDYLNGIPILNVTPNDIRPIDRETGLLVNIPSEIIDKLAVDSAKTAEGEALNQKIIKQLVFAVIGMAILFILALSYINQTNSELQVQLANCALNAAKSATIITG